MNEPEYYAGEFTDTELEGLLGRLRRFVEDSDLSFYQIASCVGTTGTILSMWLARTAEPNTTELAKIESFFQDSIGEADA